MNTMLLIERLPLNVKKRVITVGAHLEAALQGDWQSQAWLKREALTTADFPLIFQIINNATVQAAWKKFEPGLWTKVSQRVLRDNLRAGTFKTFDTDTSMLPASEAGITRRPGALPHIPELGQYPAIGLSSSQYSISVGKFGARFPFSWEAWREDDYGVIGQVPDALVTLARRTEDTETFGVLFAGDGSGWNQTNFPDSGTRKNFLQPSTGIGGGQATLVNAPLTRDSLAAALQQAKLPPLPNASGEVYLNTISKWALLVPAALVLTANGILAATNIRQLPPANTGGNAQDIPNLLSGLFEVVEVPYIQTMCASSSYKDTMWAIVPLNGQGTNKPTLVTTFLRGEETPELRIKNDQGNALGGGSLDPYAGSFDHDAIDIRVRYFVGGYLTDRTGIVLSKGTGAN